MIKKFILNNLECASCASKIEGGISKLDGVKSVSLNFMTTRMVIDADEDKMSGIIKEAEKIIRKFEPDTILTKA